MRILVFMTGLLAMIFASTACLAEEVDLVGVWQGPVSLHSKERGFAANDGAMSQITILEQKDGAFTGKKVWTRDGKEGEQIFSGVVSPDGKSLYLVDHEDGYYVGEIVGPDEIVIYYLESGDKAKAMRHQLKKKK